jgi:hypothetical protein
MKKVFVANHPTEAHLVAGLLEAEGIAAEVQGEALFSARGEVPVTPGTLPSVWVDDAQVTAALEILRDRAGEAQAGAGAEPPWLCPDCGETVEPQFSACWNCDAARPDPASPETT